MWPPTPSATNVTCCGIPPSIKLKEVTASDLFRRLNSYSKQHALYRALKAFGQIPKSSDTPLCTRSALPRENKDEWRTIHKINFGSSTD